MVSWNVLLNIRFESGTRVKNSLSKKLFKPPCHITPNCFGGDNFLFLSPVACLKTKILPFFSHLPTSTHLQNALLTYKCTFPHIFFGKPQEPYCHWTLNLTIILSTQISSAYLNTNSHHQCVCDYCVSIYHYIGICEMMLQYLFH